MVKRGGRAYRKASQKGRRGGNTRRENLANKLREHRRYLRENDLAELRFHSTPATKRADNRAQKTANDYAVYGIYKDGSEWVLTGMACTDEIEKVNRSRSVGYSRTEVKGRYIALPRHGGLRPEDGVEIDRFDTKKAAMNYVSADGSDRVESGAYLVRPKHDPRGRTEQVDKDDFQAFRQDAAKIWED